MYVVPVGGTRFPHLPNLNIIAVTICKLRVPGLLAVLRGCCRPLKAIHITYPGPLSWTTLLFIRATCSVSASPAQEPLKSPHETRPARPSWRRPLGSQDLCWLFIRKEGSSTRVEFDWRTLGIQRGLV